MQDAIIKWTSIKPDDSISIEQMIKDQRLDEDLMTIITALLTEERRPEFQEIAGRSPTTRSLRHQFSSLTIRRGLLYRKFEHTSDDPDRIIYQIVLPRKHVMKTIRYYLSHLVSGQHHGRDKTLALLKRYFYWPHMFEDVYESILTCKECFMARGPHQRVKPPLKLFRDGLPHGRWHIHFCGPFAATKEGYRNILVAVEAFSSWPIAIPMKSQTALEVA